MVLKTSLSIRTSADLPEFLQEASVNPSVIYTAYLFRVEGKLEPSPSDFGQELDYTLGRLQG